MANKDKSFQLDKSFSTTRKVINKEFNNKNKFQLPFFSSKNPERKGEGGLRKKGYFKKSYKSKPLISIVTVVFNGEKHLKKAIKSVLEQTYDNVEYIIIDGMSTDNTLSIIKQYEEYIDYWISEPDAGIYNAMNKATSYCTGDYVAFLNADDWYNINALNSVAHVISKNDYDYVFGNVDVVKNNVVLKVLTPKLHKYKIDTPFCHQSLFLKRSILLKFGFDEKHEIISDYNLILQLIKNNYSYYYINEVLANFRYGGVSTTTDLNRVHFKLMYDNFGLFHAVYRYIIRSNNPVLLFIGKFVLKLLKYVGLR